MAVPHPPRTQPAPAVLAQMTERRDRILEAARDIVAEQGVDRLTMRELARRSRVTVPTLYNLVGGRDQVIREAVRERTALFVAGIVVPATGDPADRVLAVAEACVRELLDTPTYYRPLLNWIFSAEAAGEVQAEVGRALTREFRRALDALNDGGGLASFADPGVMAGSMSRYLGAASVAWARGELDEGQFRAQGLHDVALALCAVLPRPDSKHSLERVLVEMQAALHARGDASPGDTARSSRHGQSQNGHGGLS